MRNPLRRRKDPPVDLEQQAIDTLRAVGTDRANALADEVERGRERRQEDEVERQIRARIAELYIRARDAGSSDAMRDLALDEISAQRRVLAAHLRSKPPCVS
jgi:hypothetical protein